LLTSKNIFYMTYFCIDWNLNSVTHSMTSNIFHDQWRCQDSMQQGREGECTKHGLNENNLSHKNKTKCIYVATTKLYQLLSQTVFEKLIIQSQSGKGGTCCDVPLLTTLTFLAICTVIHKTFTSVQISWQFLVSPQTGIA